jgi:hypothetical protein
MRIKLTKVVTVGEKSRTRPIGWVGEVDDAEGRALVAIGYAKETTAECSIDTPDPYDVRADEAAASLGDVPSIYDADDADKAKSNAPQNKAKGK